MAGIYDEVIPGEGGGASGVGGCLRKHRLLDRHTRAAIPTHSIDHPKKRTHHHQSGMDDESENDPPQRHEQSQEDEEGPSAESVRRKRCNRGSDRAAGEAEGDGKPNRLGIEADRSEMEGEDNP